jgi:A/G-specific adenine glycosylase
MNRLPDVESLAKADREQVLTLWEGLGYYQRAHNLHRTAQIIVTEFGGRFPDSPQALMKLPGIGPYISAAISAFAFGFASVAIDGNLRRVFSRILDLEIDPRSPEGRGIISARAEENLPARRSADYNQALMDLGSVICTPRSPSCDSCPLSEFCLAYARSTQSQRPVRAKKGPIPHHIVAAGVLKQDGRVLIGRRPEGGLLGGLWEFPGGKLEADETLAACLRRELAEELAIEANVGEALGVIEHAYTHFRVTVHAFECQAESGHPFPKEHVELRWATLSQLEQYPMGKVDREISRLLLDLGEE